MKRTILPTIFGIVTLGLFGVATFVAEAQTGRQFYSSRQPGVQRRTPPMYDDQPVYMDQPVVDQNAPRMAPMPLDGHQAFPTPPPPFRPGQETIIMEGPVFVQPAPNVDPDPNRSLSGIDIPTKPNPKKNEEPKPTPTSEPAKPFWQSEKPAVPSTEQIDGFYARLAKLRLEKKQLAETLTLIGKIKSDEFKVKTLVELAEYVAHDDNYKKEAETLFGLAQNGVDALTNHKPISVAVPKDDAKSVVAPKPIQPIQPIEEKVPPKRPTLLDDQEEQKPAAVEKKPEPVVEEKPPVVEEKAPAETPKKRPSILLDDEPATEKAVEKTPAETPKKRPSILLDDEPAAEKVPAEVPKKPVAAEKETTEDAEKKPTTTRRALPAKKILLDEE